MRAWYFKQAGFLPVLVEMQVWPPPSFLLVSDPGSDTQSVLQFVSSKKKNLTHALTNLCTSLKSGCVFHSACLLVCFLIISLFCFILFWMQFSVFFVFVHYLRFLVSFSLQLFSLFKSLCASETVLPALLHFRLQAVLMHQLVCCLDKVKREEGVREQILRDKNSSQGFTERLNGNK